MATRKGTIDFVLQRLGLPDRFSVRAMFGEYAVYADGKVVAFVCDDQLFVKILPSSVALEKHCEKAEPFPGAKLYYLVTEDQLSSLRTLPDLLIAMAATLPAPKKRRAKGARS
ncbi:MAG TPA: TfoX/Sxy family protein [Flavobacteriales bacterium]|nr:TfoX/Sxy family protein [Flavobacteriales bacterium]